MRILNPIQETAQCFNFQDETIKKLMEDDKNIAYSYMWMRLDKLQDEDCRSRFVFASGSWVLRAIYEGLIPPVFVTAARCSSISVWKGWCETFCQWLDGWSDVVIPSWGKNAIVGLCENGHNDLYSICYRETLGKRSQKMCQYTDKGSDSGVLSFCGE